MNASIHFSRSNRAFTLTDLLVLIAVLAVLAIVTFPALAGVQNKGGRLECANNLRQIGMESMVYAGENGGWLPICTLGGANGGNGSSRNHLGGVHYTRYVYIGTPNTQITTNEPPIPGESYQNLGYLYQDGQAGNGNIFYCPATWGTLAGANSYSPLLTTDSSGNVRSSYFYNPRIVNANTGNTLRRYQTVNQLEPHRLFALDEVLTPNNAINSPINGLNPATMQHARDRGWNVLFTDGSVQFSRLTQTNNFYYNLIVTRLSGDLESMASWTEYDQVYTFLEQDH